MKQELAHWIANHLEHLGCYFLGHGVQALFHYIKGKLLKKSPPLDSRIPLIHE